MSFFTTLSSDAESFFRKYKNDVFIVQPKIDGEDLIVVRTKDDKTYAFNRYNTYYYDVPFLNYVPNTPIVLRGEMHVHNGSVYDIKKTLRFNPELISLTVHDILYFEGDLRREPYSQRLNILNRIFSKQTLSQAMYSKIKLIESKIVKRDEIDNIFHRMVSCGFEGVVVKPLDSRYEDNVWLKIKKKVTYDVLLTAVKLDKGRLSWSFRMEMDGKHVGDVSSGLTYDDRSLLYSLATDEVIEEDGNTYVRLSKPVMVEIEAQELLDSGKFRHPKVLRIREDKPVSIIV